MNEWLKIMLEEIRRKQREALEEAEEHRRREGKGAAGGKPGTGREPPAGEGDERGE